MQDYKNRLGDLMNVRIPKDAPEEEFNALVARANTLLQEASEWVGKEIGAVAQAQLLDRSDKIGVSYGHAAHERHNNVLMDISSIRKNLDAIKNELR